MRNQEGKIGLQKKVDRKICASDITFLIARPPLFYIISVAFFFFCPPSQMTYLLNGPTKIHDNAMVGIMCDDTMSERSKI